MQLNNVYLLIVLYFSVKCFTFMPISYLDNKTGTDLMSL